jgi:hypothetical protein
MIALFTEEYDRDIVLNATGWNFIKNYCNSKFENRGIQLGRLWVFAPIDDKQWFKRPGEYRYRFVSVYI